MWALLCLFVFCLAIPVLLVSAWAVAHVYALLTVWLLTLYIALFAACALILRSSVDPQKDRALAWMDHISTRVVAPVLVLSFGFSLAAILCSAVKIGAGHAGSYWFQRTGDIVSPTHPLLLVAVNFPFDLATILISIRLLKWVVSRRAWIVATAVIDIVVSAALVVMLHTALKVIESRSLMALGYHMSESCTWFAQFLTAKASSAHQDMLLTPLLLTTFVPVVAYMSTFIILGVIVRPFAHLARFLCRLLDEKEKTPFAELAMILALLTSTAKALAEWPWLVRMLFGG